MNVLERGPRDAPTVVLLHGAFSTAWSWEPQLETLQKHFHVFAPDLPGHGLSPGVFSMDTARDAVIELIKTRAHDSKAHLVGISLGAQLGLSVLARAPDLIERSALSGAWVNSSPVWTAIWNSAPMRLLIRALFLPYMPIRNVPWLVKAMMSAMGISKRYYGPYAWGIKATNLKNFEAGGLEYMRFQMPPELARVTNPTLILVGERERLLLAPMAERLERLMPGAVGAIAPGVWHNWQLEHPELFNRCLLTWLQEGAVSPELRPLHANALSQRVKHQRLEPGS
jgi:pimeloyl-ACP methyl ester carboxylesterase